MPDAPSAPGMQSGSQIIERKLATILSADVAEFSRLMNEDEEQTLRTFRGHKKIFESLVTMHHGRIFNTAGDAILAEFSSAVEAVRCATDVQSALRTRNDQLPSSRQVRFRIGINLGDVMIQGQDLLGDGVNVAARLQTAAEPGGICISGSVHDQIINKLTLSLHSLGERSYKNIPQPIRTFSIVEAEDGKALPRPKARSRRMNPLVWVVAGLVIAGGVGYAAYVIRQHARTESTPTPASAVSKAQPTLASSQKSAAVAPAAEQPATAHPGPITGASAADKTDSSQAAPKATSVTNAGKLTVKPEAKSENLRGAPAGVAAGARTARNDGVYSGEVCYGKTRALPEHCFHAQGDVRGAKITGSWPVGSEDKLVMTLEGEIDPFGDVTILMHSDRPDGTRVGTINLSGTIRDGSLEASGQFVKGRPVNLSWRLTSAASR